MGGDRWFFFCLGREQMVKATRYENEKWIFKFWRINFSFFQPLLIYLLREEVEIIFFLWMNKSDKFIGYHDKFDLLFSNGIMLRIYKKSSH